jgi:hypothetical protein
VLSPANDLDLVGRQLRAFRTILVPDPAPLASVDQLKVGVRDSMGNLSQGSIPSVVIRRNISTLGNVSTM